jgi:hypothetical protein
LTDTGRFPSLGTPDSLEDFNRKERRERKKGNFSLSGMTLDDLSQVRVDERFSNDGAASPLGCSLSSLRSLLLDYDIFTINADIPA